VRFNPWLFSGTPQLIEHFFTELSSQLREAGRRGKREGLVRLSETLSGYVDILDPLRFVPGVDAAVRAGRASAGVFGHLGRKPTSAHEQKAVLDKLLGEHDERLVIVMDDIDRLTDSEIRDVMRLVRLVGDFPNTVYVLAYAPKAVARALGGEELVAGQAYLEKIVQVTVPVPAIDPEQLSTLLSGRIEAALAGLSYELDREQWSSVYMGMRPFFRTLRDVLRYCNAVRSPARHLVAELDETRVPVRLSSALRCWGGFAAYGIAGKAPGHELLLRALPVALALIGIELLQNFMAEGAMARARMAIEDALESHLGVSVLVYDKYVRLRKGVIHVAVVVGGVFVSLYGGVVYLTQSPDAPSGKGAIKSSEDIVLAARIATGVTGLALLVVIVVMLFEERRRSAPVTIAIPRRRADSEA
jgi:hypothetical protein